MKILMFGWEFSPSISGGLGTACRGMAGGLLEEGAEIIFVAPTGEAPFSQPRFTMIDGTSVSAPEEDFHQDDLKGLPERPPKGLLSPYMTAGAGEATSLEGVGNGQGVQYHYGPDFYENLSRYAGQARTIARQASCQVIVAHDWMAVPAGLAAREELGCPLVVHIHSLESDRSPLRINEYSYGLERFGMLEADHVIAVSHYTKNKIITQYGVPAAKITVIHNAALTPEIPVVEDRPPRNRTKRVLFLGRVTWQKGPAFFVDAAEAALAEEPDLQFVVVGSGALLGDMKDRVVAAGIAHRFEFTGFLKGADVSRAFARSDLYVMPSLSEPFGIAALEAVLQGVPVILSRQSGVSEVLQSCPSVDYGDVTGLATAILAILSDEARQRAIVEAARKDMEGLSWTGQARRMLEVYQSLITLQGR